MRRHSTRSRSIDARNAALRRLATANRVLIAGSVALTGVLADVAAASFKGATHSGGKTSARRTANGATAKARHHTSTAPAVKPPASPPKAAEAEHEPEQGQETSSSSSSSEAASTPESSASSPEASSTGESSSSTSTPESSETQASAAQEAELAELQREREEPAVSGGS